MKIMAVALDMDGTLLQSNHEPSEKTCSFLREIEQKGVKIIIATGRSFEAVTDTVDKIGLKNAIVLCYNGAAVLNYNDKTYLYQKYIEDKYVRELIKIADNRNIHINLYQDGIWYVDKRDKKEVDFYCKKCGITPVVKDHNSFESYSMPKNILIGSHEDLLEANKEIHERLNNNVHTAFSSDIFLEIMNKEVNKGNTLKYLLNYLNIPLDKCAAFGDAENDLEMLLAVKYGVAMGNSDEDFKKKLNYITSSNDEDGIVEFLKNRI